MKILIIWEEIPEDTKLYVIELDQQSPLLNDLDRISGHYTGLVHCPKEVEEDIHNLARILEDCKEIDKSSLFDFQGKVCHTGVML